MSAVEILLATPNSSKFQEDPIGYFSVLSSMVEDPADSGLYDPPSYMLENPAGSGLYLIPSAYIGSTEIPLRNIKNFSVQEDATPIEPSSTFGGVGRIEFGINETQNTRLMIGQVTLVDGTRGKTSGAIKTLNGSNGDVTITADSALGLFNTDRTAQPFVGTLAGAVQYYCDLVGIDNDVVVDASVANRTVVYPGFRGNVWVSLKQMLVKEQVEIALVFNRVYVRPLRLLEANLAKQESSNWTIENTSASRAVEIYYYNHEYGAQREIYPLAGQDSSILFSSLAAGESRTETIQLNASVVSVNQPVYQTNVLNQSYANTNGVYSAFGNDNLPVTAAQWTSQGGKLQVVVTDDPSVIEVTVTAPSYAPLAPYTIGVSSGGSNAYNSLHITGTAVVWNKKLVRIPTGATNVTTSEDVGVTVDNPYISSLSQAHALGMKAAGAYAGVSYKISGNALDINRNGEGRALIQATIGDFNEQVAPGTTISLFNDEWVDQTIADFNAFWQAQVDTRFQNQLFGNAIGARISARDAYFRLVSATTTESIIQFSADLDTLVSDFNTVWGSSTVADFNAQFVGYTCKDFSIVPLRRE